MVNRKVIIIGIDSLEPRFVESLVSKGISRGFTYFYEDGIVLRMQSTFPPDTVLAWPAIYTGLIPQRFGLEPEPESILEMKIKSLYVRSQLKGRTFWDFVSKRNKRVCVINPIFAYPPWRVNGIMVSGPSFGLEGKPLSVPQRSEIKNYRLGTYGKTPLLVHEYKETFREAQAQLLDVFRLTKTLLNEENYNLVFTADYTLDRIQHYFWRFDDRDDLNYPKLINLYKGYIKEYYRLLDRLIKYFIEKYSDEYTIIVLGDHGHSRRPVKLLSIEKILNSKMNQSDMKKIFKDLMYLFAYYSGIDVYIYKVIRYMQSKGKLGRMLLKIEEERNEFENTDLIKTLKQFGLKEYVGIRINSTSLDVKTKFKKIVSETLHKLGILDFAMSPEEFYGVEGVDYGADLYIKLRDFGNNPEPDSFLILPNFTKRIISGGHAMYTLFMVYPNKDITLKSRKIKVQDVAPTILSFLGLDNNFRAAFDGVSLL